MKTIKNTLLAAALLAGQIAFSQETATRQLSSFSKVQLSGTFDVVLEQGNANTAKIEVQGIDPSKIITEVEGDALNVYMEKGEYHHFKAKVYITYKTLQAINKSGTGDLVSKSPLSASEFNLNSSGSGNIHFESKIKTPALSLRNSGSGNIKINGIEADNAELAFSGSGNIELGAGYAKKESIQLSGSGNVDADDIKAETCTAALSGSGNINVNVSNSLEGRIAGSGNITYEGDAQVKKLGIIGSGKISKK